MIPSRTSGHLWKLQKVDVSLFASLNSLLGLFFPPQWLFWHQFFAIHFGGQKKQLQVGVMITPLIEGFSPLVPTYRGPMSLHLYRSQGPHLDINVRVPYVTRLEFHRSPSFLCFFFVRLALRPNWIKRTVQTNFFSDNIGTPDNPNQKKTKSHGHILFKSIFF